MIQAKPVAAGIRWAGTGGLKLKPGSKTLNAVRSRGLWEENKLGVVALAAVTFVCVLSMLYVGVVSGKENPDDLEPFMEGRVVEVRIEMSDEDWKTFQLDALAEEYVQADFIYDGERIPDVAVRPKGNSSLNMVYRQGSPRLSMKVDFNFFNSARHFRGLKKINLNNGYNDPTLIREHLAYDVFRAMGFPTPRTAFVDLYVNDMHMGLYTQVEQVDKTFLTRHFSDPNGNLYKPEPPAGFLAWTGADLEAMQAELGIDESKESELNAQINMGGAKLVDLLQVLEEEKDLQPEQETVKANPSEKQPMDHLERMGLKTNEAYPDHTTLMRFLEVLNTAPDDTFEQEIEAVLDVDSVLRYMAVIGTVGAFDSYPCMGHNYYLYEIDGRLTIIPWDLNGAFGAFNRGMTRDQMVNVFIDEPTCGPVEQFPLFARLLTAESYRATYYGHLQELIEGPFSVEVMTEQIDDVSALVRPYVQADELKFFSDAEFEKNLSQDIPRSGPGGAPGLGDGDAPPGGDGPVGPPRLPPKGVADGEAPPRISPEAGKCLEAEFEGDMETLRELRTRRPSREELERLKSCLSRQEMAVFLRQQPPPPPEHGDSGYIGLKAFVVERTRSIQAQLEGTRPSGNGGKGSGSWQTGGMGVRGEGVPAGPQRPE